MHPFLLVLALTQQGLWSVDTTFGPAVRGDLTVRRAGAMVWSGDSVRFVLGGDSGQFRGRLLRGARYTYQRPVELTDGWRTAAARTVGLDEAVLARLVQQIADTDPLDPRAPLMHSLLVARHGRLVLEEYFAGEQRSGVHDTRSAGKTF